MLVQAHSNIVTKAGMDAWLRTMTTGHAQCKLEAVKEQCPHQYILLLKVQLLFQQYKPSLLLIVSLQIQKTLKELGTKMHQQLKLSMLVVPLEQTLTNAVKIRSLLTTVGLKMVEAHAPIQKITHSAMLLDAMLIH